MLCCAVLCCAVCCVLCAVLCCAVLCCAVSVPHVGRLLSAGKPAEAALRLEQAVATLRRSINMHENVKPRDRLALASAHSHLSQLYTQLATVYTQLAPEAKTSGKQLRKQAHGTGEGAPD